MAPVPPAAKRSSTAIREAERHLQDARQHQAHEEGEAEQQGDAQAAVLVLLDAPHEAPGNAEEQHEGHERASCQKAELHLNADQRAEDGRHHGQAEQQVGIAQNTVLLKREFSRTLACGIW
jgi:hypothetical protein